jgi:hypothetical protein
MINLQRSAKIDAHVTQKIDFFVWLQAYDPTYEDTYYQDFVVDDTMCTAEIIDTGGQR